MTVRKEVVRSGVDQPKVNRRPDEYVWHALGARLTAKAGKTGPMCPFFLGESLLKAVLLAARIHAISRLDSVEIGIVSPQRGRHGQLEPVGSQLAKVDPVLCQSSPRGR